MEAKTILQSIGNTDLIKLSKIPKNGKNIYLKSEWQNPTGSMKDRMAQAMIAAAERDGRLEPGGTVVEYTGGSTGTSLALICAVKDYNLRIVTSDAFSMDKVEHMRRLGAEVIVIPSEGEGITKELIESMMDRAKEITEETDGFWTNQLNNRDQIKGYHQLGREILDQTDGKIDGFVHSFGSSASIQGVSSVLKEADEHIRVIAVEPAESPIVSENRTGSHDIDGIGAGFVPPIWDDTNIDEVVTVSTADAKSMANELARIEGIFVGTSTGANTVAALRLADELGSDSHVVTLGIDTGLKYLASNNM